MIKTILLNCLLTFSFFAHANTVLVKNRDELNKANKKAVPGDIIVLQNGNWNNVTISLNCRGSLEKPITFKAQTAGKVIISGNSKLMLGGTYIIVDGLYFTNGFAGDDAVLKFRIDNKQLANNCRVTNTVINDFNNPQRMDDNYWVMLYGKNNRIDHCSFLNKKNMGVLMAVILDDERSRENFHSVDHNYFGLRLPLASNTGEIIRVGVSQHCEFNSNTQITDNFFEHCDGETEIISIKSGSNYIRNNLFKECQGSVVLRHGNYNTVENNIFLGNNKEGTGGVRVINKGQWVVNNLFYKCRGEWFRSPLSIMNGVPNSPAFRYVAVTEALVANNSFFECAPIGIGIGSDTERSVPPKDVQFINNIFYTNGDKLIYNSYDDMSGISFSGNMVSKSVKQNTANGFHKANLAATKVSNISIPVPGKPITNRVYDSLNKESKNRLKSGLSANPGFSDRKLFLEIEANAKMGCGAAWFKNSKPTQPAGTKLLFCRTAECIAAELSKNDGAKFFINLTATTYTFKEALFIDRDVVFTSDHKSVIKFTAGNSSFLVQLKAGNTLTFKDLNLDLSGVNNFITTDTSGSSKHSNISVINSIFSNLNGTFFTAARSSVVDSMIVNNCTFANSKGNIFNFTNETGNKGLYNVEKLNISNTSFQNCRGQILAMLRGGNDESTMGPYLIFSKNIIDNCETKNDAALIHLFGTQLSDIENNIFTKSNTGKTLIQFDDLVRAVHVFQYNKLLKSGNVVTDKFVYKGTNSTQ
jgi:poly(beta-D-mannuronate) lyase